MGTIEGEEDFTAKSAKKDLGLKRNAEGGENAEEDAESLIAWRSWRLGVLAVHILPVNGDDLIRPSLLRMKIWVLRARSGDLIAASSLGNEEERDNKVPPPYFTNPDARQYK